MSQKFATRQNLTHHLKVTRHEKIHVVSKSPRPSKRVKNNKRTLDIFSTEMLFPTEEVLGDLLKIFDEVRHRLHEKLEENIKERATKSYMVVNVMMSRMGVDGEEELITTHFRSKCIVDFLSHTISTHIEEGFQKIEKSFEEFTQRGSGWTLEKINYLELCLALYKPLAASSYIPTPTFLVKKKALLNIQNNDHKCLLWCLIAHRVIIDRSNHPHRITHDTGQEHLFNMEGVEFPVSISQIPLIEKNNNLRIKVYGFEEK